MNDRPRAEIVDGSKPNRIMVAGSKQEYFQGLIKSLRFEVKDLSLRTGYESYLSFRDWGADHGADGYKGEKHSYLKALVGTAFIADGNFAIIGSNVLPTKIIPINIKLATSTEVERDSTIEWYTSIGWMDADWEIGTEESWFAEIYLPKQCFDEIQNGLMEGAVEKLSFRMKTNAWADASDEYMPHGHPTTWYLRPGRNGDLKFPDLARGYVEAVHWFGRTYEKAGKFKTDEHKSFAIDDVGQKSSGDRENGVLKAKSLEDSAGSEQPSQTSIDVIRALNSIDQSIGSLSKIFTKYAIIVCFVIFIAVLVLRH